MQKKKKKKVKHSHPLIFVTYNLSPDINIPLLGLIKCLSGIDHVICLSESILNQSDLEEFSGYNAI